MVRRNQALINPNWSLDCRICSPLQLFRDNPPYAHPPNRLSRMRHDTWFFSLTFSFIIIITNTANFVTSHWIYFFPRSSPSHEHIIPFMFFIFIFYHQSFLLLYIIVLIITISFFKSPLLWLLWFLFSLFCVMCQRLP